MPLTERKKKIGIVIGQLSYGGAEQQIVLLAKGLKTSLNYEPIIYCLSDHIEPFGHLLRIAGVQLHVAGDMRSKIAKLNWLVNEFRQSNCDLIYGVLNVGNIYAGAASLILQLPLITSIRSANRSISFGIRVLTGFFMNRSACVIANSKSCIASLYDDIGVHHRLIRLIHNAVTSDKKSQDARIRLRKKFSIPLDAILIGTVALLKSEKRPEFFINICRKLYSNELDSSLSPYHFLWIGDGPEADRTSAILAELPIGISHTIHFVGARPDISDCLAAMDIFILTSAYEGMPNALLEAMASGLPCVATNVPGTRDVFANAQQGEEIGVLASNNNPEEFSKQLKKLSQNPLRMQAIGRSAKIYIKANFTPEKMIAAFQDVFTNVLTAHKLLKGR
jgi:L-malate glycosyltransferase